MAGQLGNGRETVVWQVASVNQAAHQAPTGLRGGQGAHSSEQVNAICKRTATDVDNLVHLNQQIASGHLLGHAHMQPAHHPGAG